MSTKAAARNVHNGGKTVETDFDVMYRETGPNGYPVGCNDEGDLIEIVDDGAGIFAQVLFRGEQSIAAAFAELSDRVWRDAHHKWLALIATGEIRQTDEMEMNFADVKIRLQELDERYGNGHPQNDFDHGMTLGKLQALLWLEGGEWGSIDDLVREDDTPFFVRRSRGEVIKQQETLREKVWWNRHQNRLWNISIGKEEVRCERISAAANKSARRIEKKYGKKNLGWSDLEWGILNGQLSALRWVLGEEWDMLDT